MKSYIIYISLSCIYFHRQDYISDWKLKVMIPIHFTGTHTHHTDKKREKNLLYRNISSERKFVYQNL